MSAFDYSNPLVEIATGLAHEVKNPLSLISVSIDLLELYDNKSRHEKSYNMMRREIERINNLLLSFIELAKSEGKIGLHIESFSLKVMLYELLDIYKELYQTVDFIFTCETNEINVFGDVVKMRQVIVNILKNAIESIEENLIENSSIQEYHFEKKTIEKKGTIRMDISQNRKYVVLSISDSGKGISEQDTERVFRPFYTTKSGGSGLGLYLCKLIIEEHNGDLDITGKLGEGSLVTIKLPNPSSDF